MAAITRGLWLVPLLIVSSTTLAAGRAEVTFRDPVHFADAGFGAVERERNLGVISAHMQRLAERLPAGQTLHIDVLDVDLAGHVKHFAPTPLRVVGRGADAPRIVLRYELHEGAKLVRTGEERLIDLGYFWGLSRPYLDEPLRFERRMLDAWFEERFATPVAALR